MTKTRIDACGLTRREIVKAGAGLAAVVASGKAPAMLLGARQFFASGAGWKIPYVKSGLVSWFDGIENAGRGVHDATDAAHWTDLITQQQYAFANNLSGPDVTYAVTVGDNALTIANRSISVPQQGEFAAFTLEYCGSDANNTQYGKMVRFGDDGGSFSPTGRIGASASYISWANTTAQIVLGVRKTISWTQKTLPHVITFGDGVVAAYRDGVALYSGALELSPVNNPEWKIPQYTVQWGGCTETVHAIRLYNRALSAAEVAENYAIDKARFGLT